MKGRVLIVAGSDSGGGAGIQADIKAVTALGGFAMTAITALTAQNTLGVEGVHQVPPEFVALQMKVVLEDLGADVVKTGMLHRPEIIKAVASSLDRLAPDVSLVADPVMIAKGGAALLEDAAVETLRKWIIPRAAVLTPNIPEAEVLTGQAIDSAADAVRAAEALSELGPGAVLLKGGHLKGDTVTDILVADGRAAEFFEGPRIDTPHTHGTGCTLASAVAVGLACGLALHDAVARARAYVLEAIRQAPGLGSGHGPLGHGHTMAPFEDY